jgi:hypothetical protein
MVYSIVVVFYVTLFSLSRIGPGFVNQTLKVNRSNFKSEPFVDEK